MKATKEEIGAKLDEEIQSIKNQIQRLTERVQFLCSHHWRVCKIGVMPTGFYCGFDFDDCERDEALAVMKAFGGKWDKSPNYAGTGIDYCQWFEGCAYRVQISNAKPPPSCQVVEEEVEVPARPAHKKKRFKLQCVKPDSTEGVAELPVPQEPGDVRNVADIAPETESEVP